MWWSSALAKDPELRTLTDVRGFLRRHPAFALAGGIVSPPNVISSIVVDACVGGNFDVVVKGCPPYFMVAAAHDWMDVPGKSVEQLFSTFTIVSPAPFESFRSEVVVAAFSTGFLSRGTVGDYNEQLNLSSLPDPLQQSVQRGFARVLVFTLADYSDERR